jgi:hypothetical protein
MWAKREMLPEKNYFLLSESLVQRADKDGDFHRSLCQDQLRHGGYHENAGDIRLHLSWPGVLHRMNGAA